MITIRLKNSADGSSKSFEIERQTIIDYCFTSYDSFFEFVCELVDAEPTDCLEIYDDDCLLTGKNWLNKLLGLDKQKENIDADETEKLKTYWKLAAEEIGEYLIDNQGRLIFGKVSNEILNEIDNKKIKTKQELANNLTNKLNKEKQQIIENLREELGMESESNENIEKIFSDQPTIATINMVLLFNLDSLVDQYSFSPLRLTTDEKLELSDNSEEEDDDHTVGIISNFRGDDFKVTSVATNNFEFWLNKEEREGGFSKKEEKEEKRKEKGKEKIDEDETKENFLSFGSYWGFSDSSDSSDEETKTQEKKY